MSSIVLIVDDEPAGRHTLESILEGQDYQLVMAENGQEAIQKAKSILPDVILLDVMMPGMDGFEVCRHLRSDLSLQRCRLSSSLP
ncbi:MAG: response regulator [Anaerolineales bacterium]|nr:response regulator [Anaerolineales bacterium]